MQQVIIKYNPYKMETEITIDGINVLGNPDYSDISYFVENKLPLQTWIEPISYKQWGGILAALKSDDCTETLNFDFYGRKIDYDDFVRSCKSQNTVRKNQLKLNFSLHPVRSDIETSKKIEEIKDSLLSKEFADIIADYPDDSKEKAEYQKIEQRYNHAKNKEFRVVFAGLYSSGKSMIINTLIRHDILPVSDETCTAKVCRIVHDGNIGDTVTLECFDSNMNSVIGLHTFNTDEACLNFFSALVPLNTETSNVKIPDFESIEIHVNLAHLYPSKEMESEFTLTIVDTPGTNSSTTRGISDNIYDNLDKQITIDAITNQNKDMVVICVDAQNYENESLGDLLREIQEVSEEDKGSFTDRFLFVVNKCDLLKYKSGENINRRKESFSKYLMDKKRWGIKETEATVEFVPKIFMTSAYIEYAIQKGAAKFKKDDLQDEEKRSMKKLYKDYAEEITEYENLNYMLSQACDIPGYRKQEFTEKFEQFVEDDSLPKAVSIQSGIPCIETTIRDYIERYAFPFKVRDLMESFSILLDAVNVDITQQTTLLEETETKLGENMRQREEAETTRSDAKTRKEKIEKIKRNIDECKTKIEGINIDGMLQQISNDVEAEFELDKDIEWMRMHRKEGVTKSKIDSLFKVAETFLITSCDKVETRVTEFEQYYKNYLDSILCDLKAVCEDAAQNGDHSFINSITMRQIKEMNIHKLREDTDATQDSRIVKKANPIKKQKYEKYQIFKRLKQWWADDYIYESENVYSMEPLIKFLNDKLDELRTFLRKAEDTYTQDLSLIKSRAVEKIDEFSNEIDELAKRIEEFELKLDELSRNRDKLNEEKEKQKKRSIILQKLQGELNFGGYSDV